MPQVIFTIDNKKYPIFCQEGQENRLKLLAELIAQKETEIIDAMGAGISHEMLIVMIAVVLADELMGDGKNKSSANQVAGDEKFLESIAATDETIKRLTEKVRAIHQSLNN